MWGSCARKEYKAAVRLERKRSAHCNALLFYPHSYILNQIPQAIDDYSLHSLRSWKVHLLDVDDSAALSRSH